MCYELTNHHCVVCRFAHDLVVFGVGSAQSGSKYDERNHISLLSDKAELSGISSSPGGKATGEKAIRFGRVARKRTMGGSPAPFLSRVSRDTSRTNEDLEGKELAL